MTQSIPQTTPAAQLAATKPLNERLQYVITWLEGGCDPKQAAKELRLLAAQPLGVAGIPPGMALVPIEPTGEMLDEGGRRLAEQELPAASALEYQTDAHIAWDGMIAIARTAAPQPPAGQQDRGEAPDEMLPPLPASFFRINAAPHAASGGTMVDAYRGEQVRQAQREAFARGMAYAGRQTPPSATIEAGPWKSGLEYLPYHPDASHVRPDYRDGWNACYAASPPLAPQREPLTERDMMRACINACDSLHITRVHELGGVTRTIMEDAGLLEIGRAVEAAHGIKEGS